jgi:hypothetical protein
MILTRQSFAKFGRVGAMIQHLVDISELSYKSLHLLPLGDPHRTRHDSRFLWVISTDCGVVDRPRANPLALPDIPLRTMLSSLHPQPLATTTPRPSGSPAARKY